MHISLPPNTGRARSWDLKKQAATRMTLLFYLIPEGSYWKKFNKHGGTSYFNAAAMSVVTDQDQSHNSCHFELAA
ncbi:hypothetical protein BS78_01G079500 [Paspalum vaginatum]|nr:hypothetical protein BS78_01G079500 [Paspalum vaginatum]